MVLTTFLTGLGIWYYARGVLRPTGALVAALGFLTMGYVFDLGRRVETDGLFALLLSMALFVWHAGAEWRLRRTPAFAAAALLAAMATLTKGLQGPVAFVGAVGLYLLVRREWRILIQPASLVAVGVFVAAIAVWQVPFAMVAGWEGVRSTWFEPGTSRLGASPADLATHLATFPLEVLAAMLPWSPLLLGLLDPESRRGSDARRRAMLFACTSILAIMGPVWLSVGGHHRYVMPMYPAAAFLCGAVVDRGLELGFERSLRRFVRDFVRLAAVAILVIGLGLAGLSMGVMTGWFGDGSDVARALVEPRWVALAAILACTGAGVLLLRRASADEPRSQAVPVAVAATLAILFNGPILSATIVRRESIGPAIEAFRESLPPEVGLASVGRSSHKFIYWWGRPIPVLAKPASLDDIPPGVDHLALTVARGETVQLPFARRALAEFNMDRNRSDDPEERVVVVEILRDAGRPAR